MFEECCQNDMKLWFEKHMQRMEDELRSRNCYVNVDPQRSQRVIEEVFMSSGPRTAAPHQQQQADDVRVLCELLTTAERFAPEDVSVTLRNREVTVHARKEVPFEDGYSLREIKKIFKVPQGFALDQLQAQLTDSKIVIRAPVEKRNDDVMIKVVRIADNKENMKEESTDKESKIETGEKEVDTHEKEEEHLVTLKLNPKAPMNGVK